MKKHYENKNVDFEWKVVLMDKSDLPTSHEQHEWLYHRSGTMMRSPFMLSLDWADAELSDYLAPLTATLNSMLEDTAFYKKHAARFGAPPA